ncbi:MAG: GNAT family N-acetyltransferase [Acidimicrobiales bacterium]|nr:GNAT family N-acetyltransferase [Acidimicrobiales bacterium]MDG2217503.1 GNAT family N-acetyltransferase [Acidimicrobiales bacterium]
MKIRAVTEADLDQIVVLNQANLPAVGPTDRAQIERFVEQTHSFLVAATPDDRVGGFLVGLPPGTDYESMNYAWFSARYDNFIYVDRIVVGEAGQGQGTGQRLYDAFAGLGRESGADVMLAEVNVKPRNDQSLRFHERYGFVSVGERDTGEGDKRVVMLEYRFD